MQGSKEFWVFVKVAQPTSHAARIMIQTLIAQLQLQILGIWFVCKHAGREDLKSL